MKTHPLTTLAAVAILGAGLAGCSTCCEKKDKEAKLEAEAKISKTEAEGIALGKVPGGSIKEAEIENEHGKLVWSFDIATPDSKDITEVLVDAKTGGIVSIDKETPEEQAKEKAEDAKKEKKDKDDDKDEKGEHK